MINKFAAIKISHTANASGKNHMGLAQWLSDVKINANKLRIIINPFSDNAPPPPSLVDVSKAQRMMKISIHQQPLSCRRHNVVAGSRNAEADTKHREKKKEPEKNETLINELRVSWFIPIDEFNGLNKIEKEKMIDRKTPSVGVLLYIFHEVPE